MLGRLSLAPSRVTGGRLGALVFERKTSLMLGNQALLVGGRSGPQGLTEPATMARKKFITTGTMPVEGLFDCSAISSLGAAATRRSKFTNNHNFEIMQEANSMVMSIHHTAQKIQTSLSDVFDQAVWQMSSTLKKRRAKMNKHKLRKRRKLERRKSK